MAGGPIYPFDYAEVKEDKTERCTLTFSLKGLTKKSTVDASIAGQTLTVETVVNGKMYQIKPPIPGEVEQGRLSTVKVTDGKVHVTFKKLEPFTMANFN